jgi:hypothetical protein
MPFDVSGVVLSANGGVISVDSGATNWMKVNTNGIVTRPQTPYMRGQLTGLPAPYNATPLKVTADVNVGGCWNNAAGIFTCPVAGYYMVQGGGLGGNQAGYFNILKNETIMHFTHWNHAGNWHYVNLSAVINAAVGDYFYYSLSGLTPATTGFYGAGNHGMYSIALMA